MTDSHCHIAGEKFAPDLAAVVERARAAGVTRALVILAAEDVAECARAATVLAAWPDCRFAVGIHPHHAHLFAASPADEDETGPDTYRGEHCEPPGAGRRSGRHGGRHYGRSAGATNFGVAATVVEQ